MGKEVRWNVGRTFLKKREAEDGLLNKVEHATVSYWWQKHVRY